MAENSKKFDGGGNLSIFVPQVGNAFVNMDSTPQDVLFFYCPIGP